MKWLWIAIARIKEIITSKYSLATMFILPLLFIYIIGNIYSPHNIARGVPIMVVDEDDSQYSRFLIQLLKEDQAIEVREGDFSQAKAYVKSNRIEGAYVIKAGFESQIKEDKTPGIEVYKSSGSYGADAIIELVTSKVIRLQSNARAANIVVREYLARGEVQPSQIDKLWEQVFRQAESYWYPNPLMELEYKSVYFQQSTEDINKTIGFSQGPNGLILTFVALLVGYGISLILKESEDGTLKRLYLTCLSPAPIILGNTVAMMIISCAQIGLLIGLAKVLFGIEISGPISYIALIYICYVALWLCIVAFLASMIKKSQGFQNLYSILIIFTSILGGCFWSIDILPRPLQAIAMATPQGIAMKSFNQALLGETTGVMVNCGLMMVVGLIIIMVSNKGLEQLN